MAPSSEGEFLLPLFPLPNVVLFPHTRLPLHIFEPRYRQMIHDVLEGDQRFGLILLRPGWEAEYQGNPPVHECGTVAIVEQALALDDGRYNIVIQGDVRFRIVEEVMATPYRTARVVEVPEGVRKPEEIYAQREWLADVSREYLKYLPDQIPVPEIDSVTLESLTNALVMSLNIDIEEKQKLLEVPDVIVRAEAVGTELTSRIESLRFLAPFRHRGDPTHN
jgi:uncharacterized protein